MRRLLFSALCCGALASVAFGGVSAAARGGASTAGRGAAVTGGGKVAGGLSTAPPGWTYETLSFQNPTGTQSYGSVFCPSGTVAWGGGVTGDSTSVLQNINSSYPFVSGGLATGWQVFMNNASGTDSSFVVYAVCAAQPKHYSVQRVDFLSPNGFQTAGSVSCPLNKRGKPFKAFGGGAVGDSASLFQNINSSIPVKGGWKINMNNASGADSGFTVYVICGVRTGYKIIQGTAVTNPAGAQTFADVACPTTQVFTDGGGLSSSSSTSVNMNSTFVNADGWGVYENNNSGSGATITPYTVCVS